jgi:hypothetical protein
LPTEYREDYISDNEMEFGKVGISTLTKRDLDLIDRIDSAKLDGNEKKFLTPFGIAGIEHLSTGCKTALNILRNRGRAVNCTECGNNALQHIFDIIGESGAPIVLSHCDWEFPTGKVVKADGKDIEGIWQYDVDI